MDNYSFLKKVPLFADLPDSDLKQLCRSVKRIKISSGEDLFVEGSTGNEAYVIREGEIEILKFSDNREVLLAVRGAGEIIGEVALLQDTFRMATARGRSECKLIVIEKKQLNSLVETSPSAARIMFYSILSRWKSTEVMLRQSEKMASLGTLSAGVAHELNNPASAVKRGAQQLQDAFTQYEWIQRQITDYSFTEKQEKLLDELIQLAKNQAQHPAEMDSLIRSDREYELETWLENQGVNNAWEFAPTLVNLDFDTAKIATVGRNFSPEQLSFVIIWLGRIYTIYSLLTEIGQGSQQISSIVKSLRSYSYLDEAPIQIIDIHEGIDSTLQILRYKIKSNISIKREYASDLPNIQAFGSELNQVWTNLLDNAIYAVTENGGGQIIIRTQNHSDWIVVEIEDNGSGIPDNVKNKIFDAFFTTKPQGKGTGLGLEISYKIIVNKHRGDIKVFSEPGYTCFQVRLPVNFGKSKTISLPILNRLEDTQIRHLLSSSKNITMIGGSDNIDHPSYGVLKFLQSKNYHLLPVSSNYSTILGQKTYSDLREIPDKIDIVLIQKLTNNLPDIIKVAINLEAKSIWMQEGIIHEEAAEIARKAGLTVVMDSSIQLMWDRLIGN